MSTENPTGAPRQAPQLAYPQVPGQRTEEPWTRGAPTPPSPGGQGPGSPPTVRRWPWALGALVLGVVIGVAGGSGATTGATTTASSTAAPETVYVQVPGPAPAPETVVVEVPAPAPVPPPAPLPPPPPPGPLTTFGNGTYEVGTDVAPGKYRSAGVADSSVPLCYFDQTDSDGTIVDQGIANEGPSRATLRKGLTFKSSGCQQWTRVD